MLLNSIDDVMQALAARRYIAERGLATAIFLALRLQKPLFLEGEAGVGKTEVATLRAVHPPIVVLTSNRTREIHDALKRRCIYYWIDYPSLEKELRIVQTKVPQAAEQLSRKVVAFVQELRRLELYKVPGVAETIDWAA